jgi:iron-sulfur cluster repair protein YtfE (RIC family)
MVCFPSYSLYTSQRSVFLHTVSIHYNGLFQFKGEFLKNEQTQTHIRFTRFTISALIQYIQQWYQQMHTSVLKLVYVHNKLLHVSADHVATRRKVRYQGWNSAP